MSQFKPAAIIGSSKYGNRGGFTEKALETFNLSDTSRKALITAANHGLARSTWSTYSTAGKMLNLCAKHIGRDFEFPLREEDILEFIGWLMSVRRVKANTISSYLAGIRQEHMARGLTVPQVRSELIKRILKGKSNMDNVENRRKRDRLPMTIKMMKLLKQATRDWQAPLLEKLMMWSIATTAFHGGFRIHELLCRSQSNFDPDFALLGKDIIIKTDHRSGEKMLKITLKNPKENRTGKSVVVEVYETQGTLCPVKAFDRWSSRADISEELPLFREASGENVTGKKMNKWLNARLENVIDQDKGKYSSHSFRIGLASTMAEKGLSTEDIKEAGRWSSKAYEVYLRLPQTKRVKAATEVARISR